MVLNFPPPSFASNDESHKIFQVTIGLLLRKEFRRRLLKLPFILMGDTGGFCGALGFGGIIGGIFFNLKLEVLRNFDASIILFSVATVASRFAMLSFVVSGVLTKITLSDVRLLTTEPFDEP